MNSEITTMAILLVAGLVSGFCSSAPLGPINLWLVDAIIENAKKNIIWFLSGVVVIDLCFAALAIWGYYEYLSDSPYLIKAQIVAGIFLVIVGLVNLVRLLSKRSIDKSHIDTSKVKNQEPIKSFVFGASLCISNPGFFLFWLFVVNFLNDAASLNITILANVFFLLGVALGDGIWFGLLAKIIAKGLNLARPTLLLSIRYGISICFMLFGCVTIWRSLQI